MAQRTSTITATVAGAANKSLKFTLVVPGIDDPVLRYFVTGDPANGVVYPVPYTINAQLDASGTLGAGQAVDSPQDIQAFVGGVWIPSNSYYALSGALTQRTTNFAWSGTAQDISTILAATPASPYTTVNIAVAVPPLTTTTVQQAVATLSTDCFYALSNVIIPARVPFRATIMSDGTTTLPLIPNSLLTPINPAISAANVYWTVQLEGAVLTIRVPDASRNLDDCAVNVVNGVVSPALTTITLGYAGILL